MNPLPWRIRFEQRMRGEMMRRIDKTARLAAAGLLAAVLLAGCGAVPAGGAAPEPQATPAPTARPASGPTAEAAPTVQPGREYRAMWVSYLEWQAVDFTSEAAFTADVGRMLDDCVALGMNRVIAQVRPFSDALYPSEYFPWSHLCTGTQGQDPGFDPLDILVREAHGRGLAIEAWVNPYRVRLDEKRPQGELAALNPAAAHPEWAKQVDGGVYLDPANTEVQAYIVAGVQEILENYPVDGIHFDDYFYPTTDPSFDEAEYKASGTSLPLAEWRRQNVNALVSAVYRAVKASSPTATFGISPQGNPDNNYDGQYSDVPLWLSTPGYVDYVLPQLYWGYGYQLKNGGTRYAFENIAAEWLAMERAPGVALYLGLGAYRVGAGDGGRNEDSTSQWQSGHNLADQVATGRQLGADGYVLYRYDSLFRNSEWADLAAQEVQALAAVNGVG